ncbi:hypothetical protein A3I80_04160 [Candidatus Gottesmanbacteria bacterium RIFCSPLOWO2_02_FULL_40_10]|nr:MAG: hypothetical protein A3I80_04160 [Candidatus Gottesmanbacteria bacterium RIFCSPLOWO2_02_FULL_40_10]
MNTESSPGCGRIFSKIPRYFEKRYGGDPHQYLFGFARFLHPDDAQELKSLKAEDFVTAVYPLAKELNINSGRIGHLVKLWQGENRESIITRRSDLIHEFTYTLKSGIPDESSYFEQIRSRNISQILAKAFHLIELNIELEKSLADFDPEDKTRITGINRLIDAMEIKFQTAPGYISEADLDASRNLFFRALAFRNLPDKIKVKFANQLKITSDPENANNMDLDNFWLLLNIDNDECAGETQKQWSQQSFFDPEILEKIKSTPVDIHHRRLWKNMADIYHDIPVSPGSDFIRSVTFYFLDSTSDRDDIISTGQYARFLLNILNSPEVENKTARIIESYQADRLIKSLLTKYSKTEVKPENWLALSGFLNLAYKIAFFHRDQLNSENAKELISACKSSWIKSTRDENLGARRAAEIRSVFPNTDYEILNALTAYTKLK